MKRILLMVLCMLFFVIIKAQQTPGNSITGFVIDSTSKAALEYATISLFIKGNEKPLTGTVSDPNGRFSLNELPQGIYNILFEFIGYQSFFLENIEVGKTSNLTDIKKIMLTHQKNNLQTVTVVAQAKLLENKIDKMIFNAEKDVSSQSGVATDVLKKIPQVSVDADGNVQLAGSSGVRFLINGKPSTVFGSSIADVLQSIPASQIKSVEVITNPGAKYDAQGVAGIINIILKTNKAKGYNGNLSLTTGTRQESGSFNFNVRHNNFGMNAFVSANKRLNAITPAFSKRLTYDANEVNTLTQDGSGKFERHAFQAGTGFDWTFKKSNSFSGSVSYNNFGMSGNRFVNQSQLFDSAIAEAPIFSRINTAYQSDIESIDAALNYKRTFAREGQELEISVNSSFGKERYTAAAAQLLLPMDSLFYGTSSINPGKTTETEINIDYTQPLHKDVILAAGGKTSFYDISSTSDVLSFDPFIKAYNQDVSLANDLNYRQRVYAIYGEITFPVSTWFDAKIGGRYERTEIDAYYANAQQQVNIPGYNTFVPSFYVSKKITENQTIRLGYSKRIERPDYDDLNPFVNTNDPRNLSAGNSFLKPELAHKFELAYNKDLGKKGSFMINLFYRINQDDIQPYINYYPSYKVGDSIYTNVAVTTRQNIGNEQNLVLNMFTDMAVTTKFNLRGNLALFRRHTINQLDAGYDYTSFNYKINLNAGYQFSNNFLAEFFGNFNSARNEAQGKYPTFTTYSLALRRQFWNKKGSLALTANNFLSEYVVQKTILSGPGFSVNNTRKIPFRSVALNFTWKFGKLEFKKNKEADANPNGQGE